MFITSSALKQQFIPVQGIVNARDLGGYIMQDGRKLRDGMLIRAAHLADATDDDLHYLSNIPLAKIIDFRKDIEIFTHIKPLIIPPINTKITTSAIQLPNVNIIFLPP